MTISNNVIWEVQTVGSDDNGGGFVEGASGVDYSRQASAQKSGSDLTMHPSTNTMVQPVSGGVSSNDIGNIVNISSGTNWTAGFYEITAEDGTYWTLDRSPAAAGEVNTASYKMGGAFASPGRLTDVLEFYQTGAYIKAGTYTLTTATAGSGGPLEISRGNRIIGYETTRGDNGRPTISAGSVTGVTIITQINEYINTFAFVKNLILDGNNGTSVNGIALKPNHGAAFNVKCVNCVNGFTSYGAFYQCVASSCDVGFNAVTAYHSYASNCGTGFKVPHGPVRNCISYNNTNYGFWADNRYSSASAVGCIAANNGSDGFYLHFTGYMQDCISVGNGGYAYRTPNYGYCIRCAYYGNSSDFSLGSGSFNDEPIALTADPFVNAANGDFNINTSNGGGAALRSTSYDLGG